MRRLVVGVVLPLLLLGAAALSTGGLKLLPGLPVWLGASVSSGVLAVTAFAKTRFKSATGALATGWKMRREALAGPDGRVLRVHDATPDLVGVHRGAVAESGQPGAQSIVYPYVRRDAHERLVDAIRSGGLVLVQGASSVGKTRLALEAAREAVPEWRLVVPGNAAELVRLGGTKTDPVVPRNTVVWLEDLEGYLTADGVTAVNLLRVRPSVAVVATLRLEAREALLPRTDDADRRFLNQTIGKLLGNDVALLLIDKQLSIQERARAGEVSRTAHAGAEHIVRAMAQDNVYGFGPFLAGGPAAAARWRRGREGENLFGAALIGAAVDCRRAGYPDPIPCQDLADLARDRLVAENPRTGDPDEHGGFAWATSTTERGTQPCLTLRDGAAHVFDYLIETQDSTVANGIPDTVWTAVSKLAKADQLFAIGVAAIDQDRLDQAETVFARGGNQPDCLIGAGYLAEQRGESKNAEARYRSVIARNTDARNTDALNSLGNLLSKQPGREAEAEKLYKAAIKGGDTKALNNLGNLLARRPGGEDAAEEAFKAASAAGNAEAHFNLGVVLSGQPGREDAAEEAFKAATDAGNAEAHFNLGVLLARRPGREDAAEEAFRAASDAGNTKALNNLGALLSGQPGREAAAEEAFRAASDAGNTGALFNLGVLLARQPGREADAENAFKAARDAGDTDASNSLRVLLARLPGREADAEALYRSAIDTDAP